MTDFTDKTCLFVSNGCARLAEEQVLSNLSTPPEASAWNAGPFSNFLSVTIRNQGLAGRDRNAGSEGLTGNDRPRPGSLLPSVKEVHHDAQV